MTDSELSSFVGITCEILYECRDIGYGQENGCVIGRITGEVDVWGKWTVESDHGGIHYLFADEVVSVAKIEERMERK
jgi:hypothetical protein